MTNDDEGEGGVTIPPKIDDVLYEQPLIDDETRHCKQLARAENFVQPPPTQEQCTAVF